jgi:hypothetical protein
MNTFPVHCGFRRTMTSIAIHRLFLLIVTVTAFAVPALAQDIQKLDPALEPLVGPDSKLERIATGFNKWTEGPVWTHKGTLLFAEIPANNIDVWVPVKGASVFMHPSGYAGTEPFKGPEPGSNGMMLDPDGRVSVSGHARRNVWRMESLDPKAQITILADSYQGKKLNSPMIWCTNLMARCTSLILPTACPPRRTTIRKRSCRSTVSIASLEHGARSLGQNRHGTNSSL